MSGNTRKHDWFLAHPSAQGRWVIGYSPKIIGGWYDVILEVGPLQNIVSRVLQVQYPNSLNPFHSINAHWLPGHVRFDHNVAKAR